MPHLVWFRRDLRTTDNTALLAAAEASTDGVIGVYAISPEEWRAHEDAPVKVEFWLRNLRALSGELEKINIPLLVLTADRASTIATRLLDAARRTGCTSLHANIEYEIDEQRRDDAVARAFAKAGLSTHLHHDRTVLPPDELRTGAGGFYSVFTPFKRAWIARVEGLEVAPRGVPRRQPKRAIGSDPVPSEIEGFRSGIDAALWPAGEQHAKRQLERFASERIASYYDERDRPDLDSTSRLSPYLAAGVLSARQCLSAARAANQGALGDNPRGRPGPSTWISELIWREFYQHVLVGFPRVCMGRAFKPATDRIRWSDHEEHFRAWCEGRTGVPIVDAAMRQLAAQGWMHNRLRMIAAMYLTKDLFIDWRRGESWFMRHLVDGDFGANNGGWQWSASTGTDAAPYFRIFNPVSQSRRFDPSGAFIRRWVPELAPLDDQAIHDPSELPPLVRSRLNYPTPLVDRGEVKDRVVRAFKAVTGA